MYSTWIPTAFTPFVECLKSLPNLHTLSIGYGDDLSTTPLANALKGADFPQIKNLILIPAAYPLLQHCRNVEDVVCTIRDVTGPSSDGFLRSLMSNRDSKLKRLAISLALLPDPPRKSPSTPWNHEMIMTIEILTPDSRICGCVSKAHRTYRSLPS